MRTSPAFAVAAALAAGCAPALRAPKPLPGAAAPERTEALLAEAGRAFARRGEPGEAARALEGYRAAAASDPTRVEGLLGALRTLDFLVAREREAAVRARLAAEAVELGQLCGRQAPREPECDYRLAIALGQQARERTATARDALPRMVKLLKGAAVAAPRLDRGGPHRVLALLLVRAPGWPLGPGDPEQALREAEAAVAVAPDAPENQLALAEALAANGRAEEARNAWTRAEALAGEAAARGDPDAPRWREEAARALAQGGTS